MRCALLLSLNSDVMRKKQTLKIYIYNEAEVRDPSVLFEVVSTALRVPKMLDRFGIFLIGETVKTVTARGSYESTVG